jgi:hypothetical protein
MGGILARFKIGGCVEKYRSLDNKDICDKIDAGEFMFLNIVSLVVRQGHAPTQLVKTCAHRVNSSTFARDRRVFFSPPFRRLSSTSEPKTPWILIPNISKIFDETLALKQTMTPKGVFVLSEQEIHEGVGNSFWEYPPTTIAQRGTSNRREMDRLVCETASCVETGHKTLVLSFGCREAILESELAQTLSKQRKNAIVVATDIDRSALSRAWKRLYQKENSSNIPLYLLAANVKHLFSQPIQWPTDHKIILLAHRFFTVFTPLESTELMNNLQSCIKPTDRLILTILNIGSKVMRDSLMMTLSPISSLPPFPKESVYQDYAAYIEEVCKSSRFQRTSEAGKVTYYCHQERRKASIECSSRTGEISFALEKAWSGLASSTLVVTYRDPQLFSQNLRTKGWEIIESGLVEESREGSIATSPPELSCLRLTTKGGIR